MKLSINGQEYEFENGKNALDIAGEISKDLKKTALAARINGRVISLPEAINEDGVLEILDFSDADGRKVMRHTASHVLAQAVKKLRPEVKLAIGPAIDNGFYYDFDVDMPFTPEFLKEVEKEMARIIKKNERLERFELPRAEALELMKDEPYKVELINDLPEDAVISFYRQGEFTDLCAGPHLPSTGRIKAVKLLSTAGAYWRGSEKNKMLQRIYGTAFDSKEALDAYVTEREEALKRDHNKLGRELEYFTTVDVVGQGLPIMLPKGARVIQLLQRFYPVDQGAIYIDGENIAGMDEARLHALFGVAFQSDAFFAGTIYENIDLGRGLPREDIERAARCAQAEEFILARPGQYASEVHAKAVNLSGGQKQRLLIARALAGRPEILILDDSSSALDYRTDAMMRAAVREEYPDTTVILVAQRVSSVKSAHQILVLEEGAVAGLGTHEALMRDCAVYRQIAQIQMGGNDDAAA